MRIAILLPDLRGGGAEGVRVLLAQQFVAAGHEVEFVLLRAVGDLLTDLPDAVRVHSLECNRLRQVPFRLANYLRRSRPDVLLAAMWPLTGIAILSNRFAGSPSRVVVSEHSDLRYSAAVGDFEKSALRVLGRYLYGQADAVVAVSSGVANSVTELTGLNRRKIHVIHNPIRTPSRDILPADNPIRLWWTEQRCAILAIGALKPAKAFDILLHAVALLCSRGTNVRLVILGEGKERTKLEELIKELGLEENVRLAGFQKDPFPFLRLANLFVLSSRWEGLGNVIIEALACGTPVVSTNCPSGPAELLENGRFGTLTPVNDVPALAKAISEALDREPDRSTLIRRAATFSPAAAAAAYGALMFD